MRLEADRRDRVRAMLADLKMPGALEAADGILAQVDGGSVSAGEAIKKVCSFQLPKMSSFKLPLTHAF